MHIYHSGDGGTHMATQIYRERVVKSDAPIVENYTNAPVPKTHGLPWQRALYFVLNVLEVILAVRLVLRLAGAGTASAFTRFMYAITEPFIAPFRGIFSPTSSGTGVLEWSTVVAMIIYALIVYAIVKATDISREKPAV